MRYVFTLSYDGTAYAGWQRQKNALSVQEVLEDRIFSVLGTQVKIKASGRTDAGVHALGQVCQFDSDTLTIPPEKLPDCINRFLPSDVKIVNGFKGAEGFDCNKSAKKKTYRYALYESERDVPLKSRFAVRLDKIPDLCVLEKYAKTMEGTHDFKAFCASGSAVKTTVRTVYSVKVEEGYSFGSRDVFVSVTGNGFLYNMVRTMVGELLALSTAKTDETALETAFSTGERKLLGKTMPPQGLTLMKVEYEDLKSAKL